MNKEISKLEIKRERLHQYVIDKLEERDYHAVQDAGSDLRELEVAITFQKVIYDMTMEAKLGDLK